MLIGCTYGDVRLIGGSTVYEGRVEVCINNNWNTVCDNGWGSADARVVCGQLGYSYSGCEFVYTHALHVCVCVFVCGADPHLQRVQVSHSLLLL